ADLLGRLLTERGRGWVHVNPIPLNPTPGSRWTASDPAVEDAFVRTLRGHGLPTTVRDTRGADIDGACGPLAAAEACFGPCSTRPARCARRTTGALRAPSASGPGT